MKKVNGFDGVFEAVYNGFTKSKNYQLVLECKESTELITFFLQHLLDINNYYTLYKHSFIPAANKSVAMTKTEYSNSKYKSLIKATSLELKENLYETVRLGYVGLSHKIEGYTKSIRKNNELIKKAYEIEGDFNIITLLQSKLGVDFINPISVPILNKIRIISNAMKHNSGFPQLADREIDDIRKHISEQNMNTKINIEPEFFLSDIKRVIDYFNLVNTLVNIFVVLHLSESFDIDNSIWDEKKKKIIEDYKNLISVYCS